MAIRALAFPRQRHKELMPDGTIKRRKTCDATSFDATSFDATSYDAMSIGIPHDARQLQ
jgi:hypothetical protein